MKRISLFALLMCVLVPASFAAKPTSFKYVEEIVMEDQKSVYALYRVKCSNNKTYQISAFNNKKLWCEGKGIQELCAKKNIKLGKKVCKKSK